MGQEEEVPDAAAYPPPLADSTHLVAAGILGQIRQKLSFPRGPRCRRLVGSIVVAISRVGPRPLVVGRLPRSRVHRGLCLEKLVLGLLFVDTQLDRARATDCNKLRQLVRFGGSGMTLTSLSG